GGADEWQRHECEPDFRPGKILGGDGADLRPNGSAGMHDQCDQDIDIAFDRVTESAVAGGDDNLEKVGPNREMRRNSQEINHHGHADVTRASSEKTAEQSA